MAEFFSNVWSALSSFMDTITGLLENLAFFFAYVTKSFPVVISFGQFVPTIIAACLSMVVAASIIKIIVGR